jgi:hypothetical protein
MLDPEDILPGPFFSRESVCGARYDRRDPDAFNAPKVRKTLLSFLPHRLDLIARRVA